MNVEIKYRDVNGEKRTREIPQPSGFPLAEAVRKVVADLPELDCLIAVYVDGEQAL